MTTMMKRTTLIYGLLLAVVLPLLNACSHDDDVVVGNNGAQDGGKVAVRLRLSQAAPATRADWVDTPNAEDEEMMNVWTVVIVKDNRVVGVQTCEPTGTDREIDDLIELETGTYTFYSFANIGAS